MKFKALDKKENILCDVEVYVPGTGCFLIGNSPTPDSYDDKSGFWHAGVAYGHFVPMENLEIRRFVRTDIHNRAIYEKDKFSYHEQMPCSVLDYHGCWFEWNDKKSRFDICYIHKEHGLTRQVYDCDFQNDFELEV